MTPQMPAITETASIRQLDRLCEIEEECFKAEAFTKQQIAHILSDYNSISLVAKENGRIIGFIMGTMNIERKALIGHIVTIDVSTQHRRKGIALRLLQEIEKIFKEKSVKTCYLEVREDNIQAVNLYEKTGYKKIGRLRNYYRNADGLYLRKDLTQIQ
jgi:ribosomal-protein-alanine N-acetyltransferase